RDGAAIHRLQTGRDNGRRAVPRNSHAGRPEVARQEYPPAASLTDMVEMPQKRRRIALGRLPLQVSGQAAQSAGSEFEAAIRQLSSRSGVTLMRFEPSHDVGDPDIKGGLGQDTDQFAQKRRV